ncbi:MAG TPA: deoxyribodipyrimidine photo-lyase [Saprospiraceae bacterium]|nr:deoxyribodipyrimidine photo-lyase [Saprospiraceae bacterium]
MSKDKTAVNIFWHRRDLRLEDNAGAYRALRTGEPVLSLFIFDKNILDKLEDKDDARVSFIHQEIKRLKAELEQMGSSMLVRYGYPEEIWQEMLQKYTVQAVYTNHDYEPYAKKRDEKIKELLVAKDIPFYTYKDHVIFEGLEVEKKSGGSYTVFTPYSRAWRDKLQEETVQSKSKEISYFFQSYPNEEYYDHYFKTDALSMPGLEEMGFEQSSINFPSRKVKQGLIKEYDETRNFPAQEGTSRLGIHFRFGTISIREKARKAKDLNGTFLNELIWRDFYAQILDNYPHVAKRSFRKKYDYIEWRNNEEEYQAWCEGRTGYPIVDAGMRQLNATGYMHNRVRMITASFLTKHLLIDWRWGEAYFARKLLDYDLSSNNGGWQWAAGSGTDAAPYFRIFNPYTQREKFDKNWKYVKEWVPEVNSDDYPEPIVEHKAARERCLETYKAGLDRAEGE